MLVEYINDSAEEMCSTYVADSMQSSWKMFEYTYE
jgi:hypothetical protein